MMRKFAVGALLSLLVASNSFAADYEIDSDHSTVGFKVKHLAISNVLGKFAKFSGTFSYDPSSPTSSKVDATIEMDSINTDQLKRDDHLRSADFFDAKKFPAMRFVSRDVSGNATEMKVVGDLTIKDVTKPVTLTVQYEGQAKDPWGNDKVAFSATAKINRKDFGLTYNKVLETGALVVGEDVNIVLELEGNKKKV
jgi:polyisoprenoid-binding protein YceI